MYEPAPFDAPPRKGMSTGAKIGIGCGVTALLFILVCGGFIWYGVSQIKSFAADFTSRGYVQQSSQVIEIKQPLNQSTFFAAQRVLIDAPVDGSLAFAVQEATINADVNGDIDFWGQKLTINSGVVVSGDVRIKGAQHFENNGTVQGQVSGNYGNAPQPRQPAPPSPPAPAPTTPPDAPAEPQPGSDAPDESAPSADQPGDSL